MKNKLKQTMGMALCTLTLHVGLFLFVASAHAAPTGIVGNWHMDSERGQTVLDSSPYKRDGRLGSTRGRNADDPTWTLRRFDTGALHFDNDYVRVKRHKALEPAHITVEAWVKPSPAPPTALPYIVAKGLSPQNNYCAFASYALYLVNEEPVFYFSDGESYNSSPAGPDIVDGGWHHVVGTYDEQHIRLYVDGVEIGTGTPSTTAINYSPSKFPIRDLIIGDADGTNGPCKNYNTSYAGDMDEVRVWNRALTAGEVAIRHLGD